MGQKIALILCITIVLVTIVLCLDIFGHLLYEQSWFGKTTLAKDVNPFDIIALVVSSLVSIGVGWWIAKTLTQQRYEKEFLINDLKKIEEKVLEFELINNSATTIDLVTLLAKLDKIQLYIKNFERTLKIFNIDSITTDNIQVEFRALYGFSTNLATTTLTVNPTHTMQVNRHCHEITLQIRQLIKKINKG